jgi:hypothetical protein
MSQCKVCYSTAVRRKQNISVTYWLGDNGLAMVPETQSIGERADTFEFINNKNFCSAKDCQDDVKTSCRMGEKYLQITYLTKTIICRIYKGASKLKCK